MLLFLFLFTSHKAQPRIEGGGASGSKSSVPLSYGGVKQHQGDVKNGIGQDHHWGVGESGGDRVDPEWDSGSSESRRDKLPQQTSMSTGGEHASSLSVERNANRLDHNEHRIDAMTSQVSDMGSKIESLEHDLAESKCDAFLGGMTRDNDHSGLCRVSKGSFKNIVFSTGSGASSASTKSSARPRATDYNVDNKRWLNAVDHWKEVSHTFPTPSHKTFSFSVNTHNPVTEDATISAAIQNDEAYRWPILDLFSRKLLNVPESLVVDVGANIGYFTLWAAAMGHRVVSLEPIDFNLRYLLTSVNKNEFADKVTIYQNAVSNAGGKLVPDVADKLNKGNIGLKEGSARGMYGMDYVDALKLDDIVDEEVLLLRIDAGGYEFKALDGARKLICNNIVRNIVFEFQKSRLKDSDCSGLGVACWLHSLGYKITPLDGTENLMPQVLPTSPISFSKQFLSRNASHITRHTW
jgi:FkbM family methyltransferase